MEAKSKAKNVTKTTTQPLTPDDTKKNNLNFSDSDDDPFPEIECDLCSKQFTTVKAFEQHLNSKKHFQKMQKERIIRKAKEIDAITKGEASVADVDTEADDPNDIFCETCSKTCSGYVPYLTHLKSSIHAKNLKKQKMKKELKDMPEIINNDHPENVDDEDGQKPFARCQTCEKEFSGPESFKQHMKSGVHKKKLLYLKALESLKDEEHGDAVTGDGDDDFFKCEVCSKFFSGPIPYKMHLNSSVHDKELKRIKAEEQLKDFFTKDPSTERLVCNDCKKSFTDPFSFKLHLDNNSHDKQKAKDELFGFVSKHPEIVAVKSVQNESSEDENEEKSEYQSGFYFLVCKLCHTSLSGPESARDHVKSKKHVKAKIEREEMKRLKQKSKDRAGHNTNGSIEPNTSENTLPNTNGNIEHGINEVKTNEEVNEDFELV